MRYLLLLGCLQTQVGSCPAAVFYKGEPELNRGECVDGALTVC